MPSIADLNKKLDAAGEGSQPWKPTKEGDQIAGRVTVIGKLRSTTNFCGTYPN